MLEIRELTPGDPVEGELAVRAVRGLAPYAEGYFLTLVLGNATGELVAKVWLGPDEARARALEAKLAVGDVVRVDGRAKEYRDRLELSIETPPEVLDPDRVDPSAFLPGPEQHLGRLGRQVLARARSIEDPALRSVALAAWQDEELQEQLFTAPASKGFQRARLGGLLEHAHATARLAGTVAQLHGDLDRDLLMAAALLAPLGILDEITWSASIEITDAGRLLGPGALADDRLAKLVDGCGLEDERALRLRHLVRAAHSPDGRGPTGPRTPEAVALARIHQLDVDVTRAVEASQTLSEQGETSGWPDGYRGYLDVASGRNGATSDEVPA